MFLSCVWCSGTVWRGYPAREADLREGPANPAQHRGQASAADGHDCIAVEFRTHFFDQPSRRAIERLGAKLGGVLRSHQINAHPHAQGTLRDTCVYSVIACEWPAVQAHLDHQLARAIR